MDDQRRAVDGDVRRPVGVAGGSPSSFIPHPSSLAAHPSSFLLLLDPPAAGPWNMAVDEALLEDAALERRCWLRFYRWQEPTLSLGYFQSYNDRRQHPASSPCAVVRRMSGGGAILHDVEITYSLAVPERHPLAKTRLHTYLAVHEALVETLRQRGIAARILARSDDPGPEKPPFLCFQRRSQGDVLVGGDKVAGSAQKRCRGAILQHGSVLLGRSRAAPELAGLEELTNCPIDADELVRQWLATLQINLDIPYRAGELLPAQRRAAAAIENRKYSAAQWTKRR